MKHITLIFFMLFTAMARAQNLDDPAREAVQKPDEVVRLAELAEGMTVADIGAGTGYFESRLSRAVGPTGRVLALDVDPRMVASMKQRFASEALTNVEVRLVTPTDPGLDPQSVDRVLLVDTWHHLHNRSAFAQALRQALKPGGQLIIVDYTAEALQGPPASMRVSSDALQKELTAAGYLPRLLCETLPNQYVVIASPVLEDQR